MSRIIHLAVVHVTIVFGFVFGSVAIGEAGTLSSDILRVDATNQLGSASFVVDLGEAEQNNDVWNWSLPEPMDLFNSSDQLIGTIDSASLRYVADPQIALNFGVSAGGFDTMFTISSAILGFPELNPAEGRASAGISVTDGNGDGASLTGNIGAGGKSYRAIYNRGTVFADLVDDDSTGSSFGTFTSSDASPAVGFSPIAETLASMNTEFSFTIEAFDSAGGTSIFVTIPEPSSLMLALFGLFVLPRGLRSR